MRVGRWGNRVVITLTDGEAHRLYDHIEYSTRPSLDWIHDAGGDPRYLNRGDCITGKRARGLDSIFTARVAAALEKLDAWQ